MSQQLKRELHQLIDDCQNTLLLEEAKTVLQSADIKDWWDDLNEEEKTLLKESAEQYEQGNYISHSKLLEQLEAWKKK